MDPDIAEDSHPKRKQKTTSAHKKPTRATPTKASKRITKTGKEKGKAFRLSLKKVSQQEETNSEKADNKSKGRNRVPLSRGESYKGTGNGKR